MKISDNSNALEFFNSLNDLSQKFIITSGTLNSTQLKLIKTNSQWIDGADGIRRTIGGLAETELDAAISTASLSASQKTATKSTLGLSTAFKGLAASLGITTTALGIIAAGIAVVGGAAIAYRAYAKSQEELALSTKEAAQTLDSQSQSINDYAARYEELHSALLKAKGNEEATYSIKKELLALQTELNEKFGDEYGKLNLVSDAYKNQTDAIKYYNKELANTWLNENVKGAEQATKKMTTEKHYPLSYGPISSGTEEGRILKEIAVKYEDEGIELWDETGTGDKTLYSIHLTADPQSAYDTINAFMTDVKENAKELNMLPLFNDIIELSSGGLNQSKAIIDEFGETYKTVLITQIASDDNLSAELNGAVAAVEDYNNAVLKSENPYDDANVKSAYDALQAIKSGIQGNIEEWGKYSVVTDQVFAGASTGAYEFYLDRIQNSNELLNNLTGLTDTELYAMSDDEQVDDFDLLMKSAEKYKLTTRDVIELLVQLGIVQREISENGFTVAAPTVTDTITTLNQQLSPIFSSLRDAYQDIFKTENTKFSIQNVDLSMFTSIKSILDNMSNELKLDVDYSAYEDFVKVLTNSASTTSDVKNGFNVFIQSILKSTNVLETINEDTYAIAESLLKQMGVMNAEDVIVSAVGNTYEEYLDIKEKCLDAGFDLANKTNEEISNFIKEGSAANECGQALALFQLKKLLANSTTINTKADIDNLIMLATAANIAGTQIQSLSMIQSLVSVRDSLSDDTQVGNFGASVMDFTIGNLFGNVKKDILNVENAKVDFSKIGGGGAAAGTSGKDAAGAYVEAFDAELKQLDDLKSTGKITEKQYLDSLRRLYVKYYGQKKQYLDQYEKYEHQYLSGMKSLYESAFSYITKQIDKRISDVESQRDAEIKGLETQKQAAEDAYQAQIDAVDEQIKGIEKQIDAKQDEIDAINEAAEARKRELDLQKAQYDLERMQNQKTNYVMTDNGIQYQADTTGIRDARESLDDAKREIEISKIEETINGLEQQKVILEEQRAALESALEASNAYWESQIENTNMYYDTLVSNLEAYKGRWEELASMEETAKMQATLAELGIAEQDILNMNEEAFQRVKDNYLGILADMYNGNALMQEQLSALSGNNFSGITGYLDSTKSALDTLDSMTLQGIGGEVEGLVTSSSDASAAIGGIQGNTQAAMQSIQPLNAEFNTLKTLLDEITLLFSTLVFPELGDENYVQKLQEIAAGFEQISEKSKLLAQIDFTKIIGSAGGSGAPADGAATGGSTGSPGTGANPGGVVPGGGGTGFLGFSSAVSEAVKSITLQMALLGMAMTLGNLAFLGQITMINEQYIPAWENLQSRLAEIIGVGGGKNDKSKTSPSKKSAKKTAEGDKTTAGNSGSIIDTLQLGGEMVSDKLKDPWLRSFNEFATGGNSVESICDKIKQLVEEMAREIENQCASAAQALSDLANQYFSNPALGGKGAVQLALGNAGSAISGILPQSDSTYMPLEESNPEKYEMLMRFSDQPAPIEASPFVMSDFNNEMKDAIKNVSNTANLSTVSKSININIGDIRVEGVTDAGGLAEAIKERLPNMLLQEMKK